LLQQLAVELGGSAGADRREAMLAQLGQEQVLAQALVVLEHGDPEHGVVPGHQGRCLRGERNGHPSMISAPLRCVGAGASCWRRGRRDGRSMWRRTALASTASANGGATDCGASWRAP